MEVKNLFVEVQSNNVSGKIISLK